MAIRGPHPLVAVIGGDNRLAGNVSPFLAVPGEQRRAFPHICECVPSRSKYVIRTRLPVFRTKAMPSTRTERNGRHSSRASSPSTSRGQPAERLIHNHDHVAVSVHDGEPPRPSDTPFTVHGRARRTPRRRPVLVQHFALLPVGHVLMWLMWGGRECLAIGFRPVESRPSSPVTGRPGSRPARPMRRRGRLSRRRPLLPGRPRPVTSS